MGGKLHVFFLGNAFLDMSPEAQAIGRHQTKIFQEWRENLVLEGERYLQAVYLIRD